MFKGGSGSHSIRLRTQLLFFTGVSLLFMTGLATFAMASSDEGSRAHCADLLKVPDVLEQSPTRLFPIELRKTGSLLNPGDKFPEFQESALYHYLITKSGELVFTPSYVGNRLATHKSMLAQYEELKSKTPEVVAAGDFQVAFNHVIFLDNRSGNFRGGKVNLDFAAQIFRTFGAKLDQTTDIHLHDPKKDTKAKGHTPEGRAAHNFVIDLRKEVRKKPNGEQIWKLFEQTGKLLVEFTKTANPKEMLSKLTDMNQDLAGYADYAFFIYPFQTALTSDGLAFGIWRTMNTEDSDLAGATARQLLAVQKNYGAEASPELNQKLVELSKAFESLSNQK